MIKFQGVISADHPTTISTPSVYWNALCNQSAHSNAVHGQGPCGFIALAGVAAPMVGGMISSTVHTLAVIPAIYALVKQWRLRRGMEK